MMVVYRTWADVLAGGTPAVERIGAMSAPSAPEDVPGYAPIIDRTREGPPPCCSKRIVPADRIVWHGGVSDDTLARIRELFPHLANVPRDDLYLCDGCRGRVRRAGILTPEEEPRRW